MMFSLTLQEQYTYLHKVEIDITEYCNLSCVSCVRGCDKFKSNKHMDPDQIETFVVDSIENDYKWISIAIMGGEPTLHPNIDDIFEILSVYKAYNEICNIWSMTNCTTDYDYPKWVNVNRNKDHSYHHAFNVSPIDVEYPMNKRLCHVLVDCGLLYSIYGYLPCCDCAIHKRVFNYESNVWSVKDLSYDVMNNLMNDFCKHCGWYLVDSFECRGDILNYPKDYMSPTWEAKYKEWNNL